MKIRKPDTCATCGAVLDAGTTAWWDPNARLVHCAHHDRPTPQGAEIAPQSPADSATNADGFELPRKIAARYDGTCAACGNVTAHGETIYWSKAGKVAVCSNCMAYEGAGPRVDIPGGGAQSIADRAAAKHAAAVRAAFPELADLIIEMNQGPRQVHAWAAGADGERVVGHALNRMAEKRGNMIVLHDRMIPETGGNIDHLVIAPRRIGVLDAKNFRGRTVQVRDIRGAGANDRRLFVDDRDVTSLADDVRLQSARVDETLGLSRFTDSYLVFVNAKLGHFGQLFRPRGVWCMSPKEAAEHVAYRGPIIGRSRTFDADERAEIAEILQERFPANVT